MEIEIKPDGIKKLEDNLDRCVGNPRDFSEKDWENLHNPNEDIYEHIIAYVHFDAGTDKFNKLFIEVFTSYDDVELEFEDDAIEAIAREAHAQKTGARGLRTIMEKLMMDVMFDIPSDDSIVKCIITKASVDGLEPPKVVKK